MKGRDPIEAADAKAEMKDNGMMYPDALLPKEGQPLRVGSKTVTQKFKLKNMMYNGKLEI